MKLKRKGQLFNLNLYVPSKSAAFLKLAILFSYKLTEHRQRVQQLALEASSQNR